MNEYCTIGEIKTYSVLRYTKYGTCDISLTPDDYEGKTKEEIEKLVQELASESDSWQLYDDQDEDSYEVTED